MTCPKNFVKSDGARLLNGDDVKDMTGNKRAACCHAAECIRLGRSWLSKGGSGLTRGDHVKLLTEMEVRFVVTIHSKRSKTRQSFDNVEQVKQQFLEDIYAKMPEAQLIPPPWPRKHVGLKAAGG